MSSSLKALGHFLARFDPDPRVYLSQEGLKNTIEQELGSLEQLEEKVQELAKRLSQNFKEVDQETIHLIERIGMFSASPNPVIQELFQGLYQPFASLKLVPVKFDREMEAFKKKNSATLTDQDIRSLLSLKDQLPSAQLAVLAHTFSHFAKELQNDKHKELLTFLKQSQEEVLQQLKKVPVRTFRQLQSEIETLKQKSYLKTEESQEIASILISKGMKKNAFDEFLHENPSALFDREMKSFKEKHLETITGKDIRAFLNFKDQLSPVQLAILAHTLSNVAEGLQNDKKKQLLIHILKQFKDDVLKQLEKTLVITSTKLQAEIEALKQKSYLSESEKEVIASTLTSKVVEEGPPEEFFSHVDEDYQALKELLQDSVSLFITIQDKLWTPSMVQILVHANSTLEQLQKEFKRNVWIVFENKDSLKLSSYERHVLMGCSPVFYASLVEESYYASLVDESHYASLDESRYASLVDESQEDQNGKKIVIQSVIKEVFIQILEDLNPENRSKKDESLLLQDVLSLVPKAFFYKKHNLTFFADKYEDELCRLLEQEPIDMILKVYDCNFAFLDKLQDLCQKKITSYLSVAINSQDPKRVQEALDSLSSYARNTHTLDLRDYHLSPEVLQQIVKAFPSLSSLAFHPHDSVENYQALKLLLKEEICPPLIIQDELWTPSMVQTLINTHSTFEQLQQELGKKVLMEFANNEFLELEPHQKYLLMEHSSSFYSLWTSGMKETHEGKVALENISKKAFSRILADLNQEPYQELSVFFDRVILFEMALFCKAWGMDARAGEYEQLVCTLAQNSSIETILIFNSYASGLDKLKNLCDKKISSYVRDAFHDFSLHAFENALNSLSSYAQSIDTLDLRECNFSVEQLKQLIEEFPHLTSLGLCGCNITEAAIQEFQTLHPQVAILY